MVIRDFLNRHCKKAKTTHVRDAAAAEEEADKAAKEDAAKQRLANRAARAQKRSHETSAPGVASPTARLEGAKASPDMAEARVTTNRHGEEDCDVDGRARRARGRARLR